jgi:hypothetical protein
MKFIMIVMFLITLAGCGIYRGDCEYKNKVQVHFGPNKNQVKTFYCKQPEGLFIGLECKEVDQDGTLVGVKDYVTFGEAYPITMEIAQRCDKIPKDNTPHPGPLRKRPKTVVAEK